MQCSTVTALRLETNGCVGLRTLHRKVRKADGDACACFAQDDASVKCWGSNAHGQLGHGDSIYRGNDPNGECSEQGILTRMKLPEGRRFGG